MNSLKLFLVSDSYTFNFNLYVQNKEKRQEVEDRGTFFTAAQLLLQLHTLLLQLSQVCLNILQLRLNLLQRDVIRLHLI